MFKIEKNVPKPAPEKGEHFGRKTYDVFDTMQVGDSFVVEGDKQRLKSFRSVLRTRNWRLKNKARFEWAWIEDGKMRIWRTE